MALLVALLVSLLVALLVVLLITYIVCGNSDNIACGISCVGIWVKILIWNLWQHVIKSGIIHLKEFFYFIDIPL